MAFVNKEVAFSHCCFDWLNPTMANMDRRSLQPKDAYVLAPSRFVKLNRNPSVYGIQRIDQVAHSNHADHSSPYSRTASDSDSGTATTTAPVTERFSHSHINKQKSLYKTELCRSWEEKGRCPYGNKCQYAHGSEELRPVVRHPKFKTEVCCTFVTTGTCPYGRRCRFIHKNVPITAVGKQVCDPSSRKNETDNSSANAITASSRRLPIFVKLARGES